MFFDLNFRRRTRVKWRRRTEVVRREGPPQSTAAPRYYHEASKKTMPPVFVGSGGDSHNFHGGWWCWCCCLLALIDRCACRADVPPRLSPRCLPSIATGASGVPQLKREDRNHPAFPPRRRDLEILTTASETNWNVIRHKLRTCTRAISTHNMATK